MDWAQLIDLYSRSSQHESIVWYSTIDTPASIGSDLVAMANTSGGYIIIGIDFFNFHLLGTDISQETLTTMIDSYCDPVPPISISCIQRHKKMILVISVSQGDSTPYTFNRKCYIRKNQQTLEATLEEERHLLEQNQSASRKQDTQTQLIPSDPASTSSPSPTPPSPVSNSAPPPQPTASSPTPNSPFYPSPANTTHITTPETSSHPQYPSQISSTSTTSHTSISNTASNTSILESPDMATPSTFSPPEHILSRLNKRQKRALSFLKKNPNIRNMEYRKLFNISHKTAHLELTQMVSFSLLVCLGMGRSTCYALKKDPIQTQDQTQTQNQNQTQTQTQTQNQTQSQEQELQQSLYEIKSLMGEINTDETSQNLTSISNPDSPPFHHVGTEPTR